MPDPQPNILFITSDQHRADCLGVSGHPCVRTPNLDRLATMGTRFTQAHVDCPVCIPQRTTWITGIKSHVYGMPSFATDFRVDRRRDQFLGSLMTSTGYQTTLVGKRHWHTDPSFRAGFETCIPLQRLAKRIKSETGRDHCEPSGIGFNGFSPTASQLPAHLCSTDWVIDQSVRVLAERDRTQPFFLWASMTDPHPPNIIHEPYYSMYDDSEIPEPVMPDWIDSENDPAYLREHRTEYNYPPMNAETLRKARGVYYGKITNLDHQIGRLLGQLDSDGLLENTWIVYTSDHGEHLGDFGDFSKSTFLNASCRVPFIVVPPERFRPEPEQVIDQPFTLDSLLPTFCDWAGIAPPDDITGTSLQPLLEGEETEDKVLLHGQIDDHHMLVSGKWKLLYFEDDGEHLLFDRLADEEDRADLSTSERETCERLIGELSAHLLEERGSGLPEPIGKPRDYNPKRRLVHTLGLRGIGRADTPS